METANYCFGPQCIEEDSLSNHSRSSSCHWQQSLFHNNGGSSLIGSECGSQVSVRDMIRRYNTAIKNNTKIDSVCDVAIDDKTSQRSNMSLADDASYKSVPKAMTQQNHVLFTNSNQTAPNKINFITSSTQIENGQNLSSQLLYCRNCASSIFYPDKMNGFQCAENQYENNKNRCNFNVTANHKSTSTDHNTFNNTTIFPNCMPKNRQGDYDKLGFVPNKGNFFSAGHMQPSKEVPPYSEPKENSYHSKTTIVKTPNGKMQHCTTLY